MVQIDIDGAANREDGRTVFRFSGGVRPGKTRRLWLVAVPQRPGDYRFRMQLYGRSARQGALGPLVRPGGEPLEQEIALTVVEGPARP